MVNCMHHFVCVAPAIIVSDPGLRKLDFLMVKLKLLGENPFYLKVILNIKKYMRTQKKKKIFCEHRTFSLLFSAFYS